MVRILFAGAAVILAIAAGPALAQDAIKWPPGSASPDRALLEALPREAPTPAERAQVRADWNDMAREWDARQSGRIQRSQPVPQRRIRADEPPLVGRERLLEVCRSVGGC
jgi:hypothetical protein